MKHKAHQQAVHRLEEGLSHAGSADRSQVKSCTAAQAQALRKRACLCGPEGLLASFFGAPIFCVASTKGIYFLRGVNSFVRILGSPFLSNVPSGLSLQAHSPSPLECKRPSA
jgi:hypothetical protein